jgi:hypothetical protein
MNHHAYSRETIYVHTRCGHKWVLMSQGTNDWCARLHKYRSHFCFQTVAAVVLVLSLPTHFRYQMLSQKISSLPSNGLVSPSSIMFGYRATPCKSNAFFVIAQDDPGSFARHWCFSQDGCDTSFSKGKDQVLQNLSVGSGTKSKAIFGAL